MKKRPSKFVARLGDVTIIPPGETKPPVTLVGQDGNAFTILGLCHRAAKNAGWTPERWAAVRDEMMAGDYNHLLAVAMEHFDVR